MSYCPKCGTEVGSTAGFCPECGAQIGSDAGTQGDTQQGGTQQGDTQQTGPGQGAAGREQQPSQQSQPGRQTQTHQQPAHGRGQGHAPRQGGGVSRRNLLAYGGGLAVLGGGGYLAFTMLTGGGPAGTATSFMNALNDGNAQRANSLLHPDSPVGSIDSFTASTLEQAEITIQSTEVVSQTETTAQVRMDISVSSGLGGGTNTATFEMRTYNGEWRVYQFG